MKKILSFLILFLMFICFVKADDGKEVIELIDATSNYNTIIGYGNKIITPTFNTTLGEGIVFESDEYEWQVLKDGRWISVRNGYKFSSGTWRYSTTVKLAGSLNETMKLANATKLKVNGEDWLFSYCSTCGEGSTPNGTIYSPKIVLENDGELQFFESESYRIYTNYKGVGINSFSVAGGAEGGIEPYTFSKVSGPEWINVSSEGMVSGTPTTLGVNDNLVVRVTDSENNHKDISIIVDKTILSPAERQLVEKVEMTSNINSLPVLGNDIEHPTFTFTTTEGSQIEEYNAHWYKLVGSNFKEQTGKFTPGVWQYRTFVALSGEAAETYRFDDNTKVFVDDVDYNAAFDGSGNEYYSLSIKSPEFLIKDKINSIELDGSFNKPKVGDDIVEPIIWIQSINNDDELTNVFDVEAVWQYKTGEGTFDWKNASGKFEAGKTYHIRLLVTVESDIYDLNIVPTFPVTFKGYNLTQFQLNEKSVGEFIEFAELEEIKEISIPNVTIKNNNNKVTLSWEAQEAATKYIVYRSTDNKKFSKVGEVTTNSYVDKGLTYNKKYYYKVKSCDNNKCTSYSEVVSKKIRPNKVVLSIKSASTNNIKLKWDKVGTTGYEVYRSTDQKKWSKVKTITKNNTLEFNNKSLKSNKKYYYKVRAYKKVGTKKVYGPYSDVVVTRTAPVLPKISIKSVNDKTLKITIDSVKGLSYYEIKRSLKKDSNFETIYTGSDLTYVDTNLILGDTYYYKIRVCNSWNNCSKYSDVIGKRVVPATPVQSVFYTDAGRNRVQIFMSDSDTIYGFEIYRSKSEDKSFKKVYNVNYQYFSYKYFDTNSDKYYYKIRAYQLVNGEKIYSSFTKAVKPIYDERKRCNEFAGLWFNYSLTTRIELRSNLRDEEFPFELAESVARNYQGDWERYALMLAQRYKEQNYSNEEIMSMLSNQWFTEEEITYAIEHLE